MRLSTISAALLFPLLAVADSYTTTLTSTSTQTRTVTVSQVVASVTSTYPLNSTTSSYYPTAPIGTGTGYATTTAVSLGATSTPGASASIPGNFIGAASSLNSAYAGSAGVLMMIAAAFL